VKRRISASFKDIPGGQILGSTYDYTHRLLNFDLIDETKEDMKSWIKEFQQQMELPTTEQKELIYFPKVVDYLRKEGLFATYAHINSEPDDVTKKSLAFPASRSERLQIITRGQTGAVTSLGYASLRGYGQVHPTVGEVRVGSVPIHVAPPNEESENQEDDYYIGEITMT